MEESKPDSIEQQEQRHMGVGDIDLHCLLKDLIFANLFLHLMFGEDLHIIVEKLNKEVWLFNNDKRMGNRYKPFSEQEFLIGLVYMIGATGYGAKGSELWKALESEKELKDDWPSLMPQPDFGRFVLQYCFKQFHKFITAIWAD